MKLTRLIILIACFSFSCQKDADVNQEDWIEKIDKAITLYNKKAKVKFTSALTQNSETIPVQFYEKDINGLQKITVFWNVENTIDIDYEIYLLNDVVVLEKTSGMFPLLLKRRKKTSDPCCELFVKSSYFKSPLKGKVYIKKLRMISAADKEASTIDLEMMNFKEKEQYDIAKEFSRIQDWIEDIKKN